MKARDRERAPPDLARKIELLRNPALYPGNAAQVTTVETHMSWVFLTGRDAYKMKKPVRYDYLNYATLAARKASCEEEVRLNRHLAPGVYRGIVPLTLDAAGNASLDGRGEIVEWLVSMRRLPADRMLDYLIRHGPVAPAELHAVAQRLADFYRDARPVRLRGREYRLRIERQVLLNHDVLADARHDLPPDLIAGIFHAQRTFLRDAPEALEQRARDRRIVEGHGDLRPEHICLESPPVIFDRLEFSRAFRVVDPADELAFLAMECERLGAPEVEREFTDAYERTSGDRPPFALVHFYKSHRACVRARLALLHTQELPRHAWTKWLALTTDYLRLASAHARHFQALTV